MVALPDHTQDNENAPLNRMTRYVRVRRVVGERFIEFDFAIGDPCLYVELVLPREAFERFCRDNRVHVMSADEGRAVDADMEKWRYGDSRTGNPSSTDDQREQQ
ncbi:MAG: phenol hydroxylase [Halioglobus sp.]|nr:phenol hydroxylase [Halioglobus sp.]